MSVQAATTVLRNNRKLLPKRKMLKDRLGGWGNREKEAYVYAEPSPKVLRDIKKRLIEERKEHDFKIAIVFSIAFVGLFVLFMFVVS